MLVLLFFQLPILRFIRIFQYLSCITVGKMLASRLLDLQRILQSADGTK